MGDVRASHRLTDEQLAAARNSCKSTPRTSYKRAVYFAAADDGPIKIGATCDVGRRLRELRTKSKQDLRLLAAVDGGMFAEMLYHSRFAAHRLHGEWFVRHPDILAEIARLNPPRPTTTRAHDGVSII
ncbi:GIY-YIG nuclease family protein [Sphingobium sp. AR-3-1]|uniref:GIY-YIG nuclease family protein n=1 Tax=Sphingobium psychrophilum TaxID=2728834 RepID=A0A7X9ZT43_9SPHN|nr:GIY-YIG nuclease family protein [Sphingobium psychrophilum]NML11618.1 GIY-YIG nuclease family protein [Sphingobium psychrophilum]